MFPYVAAGIPPLPDEPSRLAAGAGFSGTHAGQAETHIAGSALWEGLPQRPGRLQDLPDELWLEVAGHLVPESLHALLVHHPGLGVNAPVLEKLIAMRAAVQGAYSAEAIAGPLALAAAGGGCGMVIRDAIRRACWLLRGCRGFAEEGRLHRLLANCLEAAQGCEAPERTALLCELLLQMPQPFCCRVAFDPELQGRFATELLDSLLQAAATPFGRAWRALAAAGEGLPDLIDLEHGARRHHPSVLGHRTERAQRAAQCLARFENPAAGASAARAEEALRISAQLVRRYFWSDAAPFVPGLLPWIGMLDVRGISPGLRSVLDLLDNACGLDDRLRCSLMEAVVEHAGPLPDAQRESLAAWLENWARVLDEPSRAAIADMLLRYGLRGEPPPLAGQ